MNPISQPTPLEQIHGVAWLSKYLRDRLHGDPLLRALSVRGEVSNYKVSARGHLNFDLVENGELLQCFAWESDFLSFPAFKNGAKIVATGRVSTYSQRSIYQLVVSKVRLEGIGDVKLLFEERKRKLAAEGLFDPARKRPLPEYPFRVALVSSRRADGATDFIARLRDRRPHVAVVWCETSVQGPNAPREIAGALARASQLDVDLIVVARGGGSFEDLFAFSDENVVRAVARARHPVLSAVGHTVNQQLCDYAADGHAETPSAAAERVGLPDESLRERIAGFVRQIGRAANGGIDARKAALARALTRSRLGDPRLFLLPTRQRLSEAEDRMERRWTAAFQRRRERLQSAAERLSRFDPGVRLARRGERLRLAGARLEHLAQNALARYRRRLSEAALRLNGNDPDAILQKGYAIVTHEDRIVRDSAAVPVGGAIHARVARGSLAARVEHVEIDGDRRSG